MNNEELVVNPLKDLKISPYQYYDEWVEDFNEVVERIKKGEIRGYSELLSLFYYGLDDHLRPDKYNLTDVVRIYLVWSYGQDNPFCFYTYNKNIDEEKFYFNSREDYISTVELKQTIAKKAFGVLCQKFFKYKTDNYYCIAGENKPLWWNIIIKNSDFILDEIVRFISDKDNLIPIIKADFYKDNNLKIFKYFVETLSTSGWQHYKHILMNDYHNTELIEIPDCLLKHKKDFIKILHLLNKSGFLLRNWRSLTQTDLSFIKEIWNNLDSNKLLENENLTPFYYQGIKDVIEENKPELIGIL